MQYALATVFWGKTFTTAVAALICALALSACGDDKTTTSAAEPAGATGSSGASAAAGDKKGSKKSGEGSDKDSKSGDSPSDSFGKDSSKTKAPVPQQQKPSPVVAPKDLSKETKREITQAFNGMIDAFDSHDVSYLCNKAYAEDFLAFLDTKGGCTAYSNKILSSVKSYSARGVTITPIPGTDLAQVSSTLTPVTKKGKQKVAAIFYFKEEGGRWKRAVPLSANQ